MPRRRIEIKRFVREVDFDALVNEFAKISPVLEVACAPINLVNHDALSLLRAEQLQHFVPDGTAALCRGLSFFEPAGNLEIELACVPHNRFTLFRQGDTQFALAGGGNSDVAKICFQSFVWLVCWENRPFLDRTARRRFREGVQNLCQLCVFKDFPRNFQILVQVVLRRTKFPRRKIWK